MIPKDEGAATTTAPRRYAGGRQQFAAELREYKEAKGCADCGEHHPHYVLEFDHRDGIPPGRTGRPLRRNGRPNGTSYGGVVSNARNRAEAWAEIEAVDVVCANCHKTRTHERREAKKA